MKTIRIVLGLATLCAVFLCPVRQASLDAAAEDVYVRLWEGCPKNNDCTLVRCFSCPDPGQGNCEQCEYEFPCNDPECLPQVERSR